MENISAQQKGMHMRKILIVSAVLALSTPAFAGKADDIAGAAKAGCGKEVTKAQALKLIKKVFLTCKSGSQVDIGGCQIKCMKENTGAVVGGN